MWHQFFFGVLGFIALLTVTCPTQARADEIRIFATYITRGVNTATISWTTEPETKGKIEYADESGAWQSTPWQDQLATEHLITILNLKPNTTYIYRISAENTNGELKSYRSTFNTLNEQILGHQDNLGTATLPQSSFQTVLSPAPSNPYPLNTAPNTASFNNSNSGYNSQSGYFPIPYIQNIYAPPSTPAPTNTPSPSPEPVVAGLFNSNSPSLIVGALMGVLLAVLTYQVILKNPRTSPGQPDLNNSSTPSTQKFRFRLGTDDS